MNVDQLKDPVAITFTPTSFANSAAATADEVASAINRQTTAVRASVTPQRHLVLTSTATGTGTRLAVIVSSLATALGFTDPTDSTKGLTSDTGLAAGSTLAALQNTGGFLHGSAVALEMRGSLVGSGAITATIPDQSSINVTVDSATRPVTVTFTHANFANPSSVTPAEVVAAINRQAQGFTAGVTSNNHLFLLSNSYGDNSKIQVAAGTTDASQALGLTNVTSTPGFRRYRALDSVSESSKYVTWTDDSRNPLPAIPILAAARIQSAEFDVIVSLNNQEIERFDSLSMQNMLNSYIETVINNPVSGSRYITVAVDKQNTAGPGLNVPVLVDTLPAKSTPLQSGNDGSSPTDINYIGDPLARSGLSAFDTVDIQLLACPESTNLGVALACLDYCANRGDAMFVGATPPRLDLNGMKDYAATLRSRKAYGALYGPWIQILNPLDTTGNNPLLWVPPVGHVLGTYARIADARGVWKAPAGDEARLSNAMGVEFAMTDIDHTDLVKNGGVNGIRAIPGSGIIIDASRTLSTDTRWLFVNVRRLFNFVKSSLRNVYGRATSYS